MNQQRKMLPGEKRSRRKEAIARKRLERAQDRDGLHIDLFEIAESMLKFAENNVVWREKVAEDAVASFENDVEFDARAGADQVESPSTSEEDETEETEIGPKSVETDDVDHVLDESLPPCQDNGQSPGTLNSEASAPANLVLDPLSGDHLKAAKRLAGYFRLRWTEQGNGRCRRLILQAKSGPQAPAETDAAEQLIAKYQEIENGATTKRLPKAHCTPQVSGTQAHFGGWEVSTTGFGSRMLIAMGADISELASQPTHSASLVQPSTSTLIRRTGLGYEQDG